MLLAGYTQVRGRTPATTHYRHPSAPWRLVLHTVEGDPSTVDGMIATARNHGNGPHLWVSPRLGARIQTVPLDRAARALARPSGTIDTNHMRAVQVEIFGWAGQTHMWDDAWNDWLGEHVVAPIQRALGGALNLDHIERTYTAGDGIVLAVASSPIRHDAATWRRCNWVTTHQRIVNNSHWDCGGLRLPRVLAAARHALGEPTPPQPTPPSEEDELMSAADDIKAHMTAEITRLGLGTASTVLQNQKTGVLYRIAGQPAPWWGLVGGQVLGPLTFADAVEFKRHHEIAEHSVEIPQRWHDIYTATGTVTVSDASVEAIAAAVSPTDAEYINGLADATAQRIAQQVLAQLGEDVSAGLLTDIAGALAAAADRVAGN